MATHQSLNDMMKPKVKAPAKVHYNENYILYQSYLLKILKIRLAKYKWEVLRGSLTG